MEPNENNQMQTDLSQPQIKYQTYNLNIQIVIYSVVLRQLSADIEMQNLKD